jgi:hypothetical protein
MSGFEPEFEHHDAPLEAFCTSGGASHTLDSMQKRGVKFCSYKTLRFKGHWEVLQSLLRDKEMTLMEFEKHLPQPTKEDTVMLVAVVDGTKNGAYIRWSKGFMVSHDKDFTAMQKCTAFPCVAAIDAVLKREVMPTTGFSYASVPQDKFESNLKKLGILQDD